MPSYNLVRERWIPCMAEDGRPDYLGLRDVLVRAHELREVHDPSPLVTVALHRLLLAILHRCFVGPRNLEEWVALWSKRAWDRGALETYLAKWEERFDLFDSERPFYQVPEIDAADKHPVLLLAQEVASGNNPTLFDHSFDEAPRAITSAEAARYLVAQQAFSIGFGKSTPFYFSDAPLTRGYIVLATAGNLFDTLALNLLAYNDERPLPKNGEDLPAWERSKPTMPQREGTQPCGYVDYLTWQSRQIHLFPEGNPPTVSWCQRQQNLKLGGDPLDPFMCFAKGKLGYRPRGLIPEKALWRDSHTLFQMAENIGKRPEVFNWLARIDRRRRDGLPSIQPGYSLSILGLGTGPGKAASVVFWRHERLPLPLAYLEDEELQGKLRLALELAEKAGQLFQAGFDKVQFGTDTKTVPRPFQILGTALVSPSDDRRPDQDAVKQVVEHLGPQRVYWPRLEVAFKQLLVDLASSKAAASGSAAEYGEPQLAEWAQTLRTVAWQAFDDVTRSLDTSARTLKAVAVAQRQFHRRIAEILGPYLKPKGGGT